MTRTIVALLTAGITVLSLQASQPQPSGRRASGGAVLADLGSRFSARVTTVLDGDTIEVVTKDGREVRIRLEGIDCPERGEPFSNVARNFTRQLAFDKTVDVKVLDVDRYGRLVARVTADGKDLSLELVSAGLASHYTAFSFDPTLEAAQKSAQSERRGLWVQGLPRPPTANRGPSSVPGRAIASDVAGPFHGNVRSRVYHVSTCRNAGCKNCTRRFATQEEALAAGFRPAGDCVGRR